MTTRDAYIGLICAPRSEGLERALARFETASVEMAQIDWGHFGNWEGKRVALTLKL